MNYNCYSVLIITTILISSSSFFTAEGISSFGQQLTNITIDGVEYVVEERVTSGNTGQIYKAIDEQGKVVSLKVIDFGNKLDQPHYKEENLHEAAVADFFRNQTWQPRHIIKMIGDLLDEQNHMLYLVNEFGSADFGQVWFEDGLRDCYKTLLLNSPNDPSAHRKAAQLIEGVVLQAAKGLAEFHTGFLYLNLKDKNLLFVPPADDRARREWREEAKTLAPELAKLGPLKLIDFQNSADKKMSSNRKKDECPIHRYFYHGMPSRVAPEYLFKCADPQSGNRTFHKLSTKSDIWTLGTFVWEFMFPWAPGAVESSYSWTLVKPVRELINITAAIVAEGDEQRLSEVLERSRIAIQLLMLTPLRIAIDVIDRVRSPVTLFKTLFGKEPENEEHATKILKPFERLIAVMKACFQLDPSQRPDASAIIAFLEGRAPPPKAYSNPLRRHWKNMAHRMVLEVRLERLMADVGEVLGSGKVARKSVLKELAERVTELKTMYARFLGDGTMSGYWCTRPEPEGCERVVQTHNQRQQRTMRL